jgi:DNA-binding NtrC family response regulator
VKGLTVLIVEDDYAIACSIKLVLDFEGINSVHVADQRECLKVLGKKPIDMVLMDVNLGNHENGIAIFQAMRDLGHDIPTIFISGEGDLSNVVRAIKLGAYDFLEKPFSDEKLILTIKKCYQNLVNQLAMNAIDINKEQYHWGESIKMYKLYEEICNVASTQSNVFICGESGTGKELIAELIHQKSDRRNGPIIKFNCSSIPENLVEGTLFGHKKGAFTGALSDQRGIFEAANYGTLFLDEIAELPLKVQAKLLRAIEYGEIQKIGCTSYKKVNVRVISATHQNLKDRVARGLFREDLYYRLVILPIHTIPLRERSEDIKDLVLFFNQKLAAEMGTRRKQFSDEVLFEFKNHHWPGNIRELRNTIERLMIKKDHFIKISDLPSDFRDKNTALLNNDSVMGLKEYREKLERKYILDVIKRFDGNVAEAAKAMQLERTYLYRKMKKFDIEYNQLEQ